ncbi:hypothetical protein ACLOJK_016612 [Asimina triloba]
MDNFTLGMILLTLSGSLDSLRPPPCLNPLDLKTCPPATTGQSALLYIALGLIALGTGGIKPCVSSFGADQFDEADKEEASQKYAFFNWFFFAINMGVLIGITFLVFLDKAAVATNPSNNTTSRWRLCTVTQVEEFKCFISILPVWASTIALAIPFAQLSTFFVSQARITDRKLPNTNFIIPPGSIPIFAAINGLIWLDRQDFYLAERVI